MASQTVRIALRISLATTLILFLFYVGGPLYWKISATFHDIHNNRQTVQQGLSEIVGEAQKTVGWYHNESDSVVHHYYLEVLRLAMADWKALLMHIK